MERCLSHYFHARRLGFEPLNLPEALQAESQRLAGADEALRPAGSRHRGHQENSYYARSCYEVQLRRYLRYFRRDQLLVLKSETFFEEPARLLQELLAWLGVNEMPLIDALPKANAGAGEADDVPAAWRQQLRERLDPTYQSLARDWGIKWNSTAENEWPNLKI